MIEILADGQPLYFAPSEQLAVMSPKLTLERGKAGSFQFILPPINKYYDKLKKLKTIVTVAFDGTQVFRGRVLSTEKDFYNCCSVYCEGDLAYLNDSVQKGEKYTGTTHALFRKIIEAHNTQVDVEKRFEIGDITIEDRDIVLKGKTDEVSSDTVDYRQIEIDAIADEWKTTFDYIETCLIDYCGGYLQTRREGGVTYLDLLSEAAAADAASQRIEFGVNMLDLTEAITAEELFTVLIPLGDENLTIDSVNNGSSELADETLVAEYGRIVKTHVFDSVNQPETLLENGRRFLESRANVPVTLTIRAVDMHLTDKDMPLIRLGTSVSVKSAPHGLASSLTCTKIEYDLENPDQCTFTFGNIQDTLTERYRKDKNKSSGGGGAAAEAAVEEASDRIYKAWINVSPESGHIDLGTLYQELKNTQTVLENQCGIDLDAPNGNINITDLKKQCDDQGNTILEQNAAIKLMNDDIHARIDLVVSRVNQDEEDASSQHAALSMQTTDHEARITSVTEKTVGLEEDLAATKASVTQLSDSTSASITSLTETTKKLEDGIATNTASITQLSDSTSASIELLTTTTGEQADSIASLTMKTDAQGAAIELKAAQDDLDAAEIRLSSAEAAIKLKAEQKTVTALDTRLSTAEADIDAAEAAIKLKASQTTVDEQGERISTAEADIDAANAAILLKASKDDLDAVSLSLDAANQTITLKADKTYVDNLYADCVRASAMETEVLKVFEKARISDLKASEFGCSGRASIAQLIATGAIIQNLAITTLVISSNSVEKRTLKMGELVSTNVWGTATTDVDLGHSHKVTVNDDGTITLGEVATTGGSFKIADTAYYKNGVSAARTAGKNDYISNLAIWGLSGSGTDFTVCAGNGTNRYADKSQAGELSLIAASKLVKASVGGVQVGTISCQDVYNAGYQAAINDAAVSVAQGSGAVTIVFGETTKEAGSIWAQASAQTSYADSTCTPWAYAYYTDVNGNSVLADRDEGRTYDFS